MLPFWPPFFLARAQPPPQSPRKQFRRERLRPDFSPAFLRAKLLIPPDPFSITLLKKRPPYSVSFLLQRCQPLKPFLSIQPTPFPRARKPFPHRPLLSLPFFPATEKTLVPPFFPLTTERVPPPQMILFIFFLPNLADQSIPFPLSSWRGWSFCVSERLFYQAVFPICFSFPLFRGTDFRCLFFVRCPSLKNTCFFLSVAG